MNFKKWITAHEAVAQHYLWSDEDIPTDRTDRDYLGLPKLARPGFRNQDKRKISVEKDKVELWLNEITRRYGIHWVVIYGEPNYDERDDESGWNSYFNRMNTVAGDKFSQFTADWQRSHPEEKPPSPENTIVYVKPTSRVHGLSAHQQIHNIGHAVWGHCGDLKQMIYQKLREIVAEFQQAFHDNDSDSESDPPTDGEIVLTIARLVNLASYRRIFDMKPGDFDNPAKVLNQVYGSLDEFLYELIAAFFRGKGWIYLKPREGLKDELEPRHAIMQHQWGEPRQWAWKPLIDDVEIWRSASQRLTKVVVEALNRCTWGVTGRPIYATYKSLSTEP